MPTTSYSITDVAILIADVKHIKEAVGEMNKKLDQINGCLDETVTAVAVLEDWRGTHREAHQDLNSKVNKVAAINTSLTSLVGILAAWLGLNK